MEPKTLILIDGHALAYRSYFALERTKMHTADNKPTWAVYGFFKAIFDLLKKVKPDAIAVSFDSGRDTFRLREYPEYKANRQAMPDPLREQMSEIVEGVKLFDIPVFQVQGYEADDVIGTIAEKAHKLGHKTLILTGDRDAFQLLDEDKHIRVLIPSQGELTEYDREAVHHRMGVWPENITDLKGLSGDSSDNIPGVKGIGEKTAVKLIEEFGSVENVLENIDKITSKSLKEKLENGKEMAAKSKYLATIDRNVPIDFDFEHTHLTLPDMEKLTDFFKELEFRSFLKQLPTLMAPFNNGKTLEISEKLLSPVKKPAPQSSFQGQLSLSFAQEPVFEAPESDTEYVQIEGNIVSDERAFKKLLGELKDCGVFSLDTETTSLDVFEAKIVGLSFAYNPCITVENERVIDTDKLKKELTKSVYIPVGHESGSQLPVDEVLKGLKDILEDKNIYKVLQNAKYEINVLKNYDIELDGVILDTMIASYIRNPSYKHGLKQQALAYLNYNMKPIEELIGTGKNQITMDKVPVKDAAEYAQADAKSTIELAGFYAETIDPSQEGVIYNIEMPLIAVLADMERTGMSIDIPYLKKLSDEIKAQVEKIENNIYSEAGEKFNINSTKQVAEIIFEKLKLSKKSKTKTGFSTSAKVLESLKDEHPIADMLLEHRHLTKLLSTYIDALPLLVNPKTGRIHTSFNQTITTTGRLSSSNPNMQNIPIKTELGNRIRAAFVPQDRKNSVIFSADYSQIELRLLAHYSKDPTLVNAFEKGRDIHADTASKIFNVPIEKVDKDMRRAAKTVNFGILYGQTSYGLSETLGISTAEAKSIIERYFNTYPKIRDYIESSIQQAYSKGYAFTMFGRKRYLREELSSRNKAVREFAERAAFNTQLQGTAADLIKLAMIKLHEKLEESTYKSKLILQIHDELVLEMPKNEIEPVEKLVKECMELSQPLIVPLVVDTAYGANWMET